MTNPNAVFYKNFPKAHYREMTGSLYIEGDGWHVMKAISGSCQSLAELAKHFAACPAFPCNYNWIADHMLSLGFTLTDMYEDSREKTLELLQQCQDKMLELCEKKKKRIYEHSHGIRRFLTMNPPPEVMEKLHEAIKKWEELPYEIDRSSQ